MCACQVAAQAVLVLLVCVAAPTAAAAARGGRSLRQQDALSNSNGCLATIPKCEPGACATRNVFGVARWICLRCLTNYAPVVDASGQDNIVQCVCPKGYFEDNSQGPTVNCTRCAQNQFCPGGDMVENPASRGTVMQCGTGLVTRTTGARSQVDCVAQAGFALDGTNSAQACSPSTYAPMFNRLSRCLRCQSGLLEPPASNLTDGQRSNKRDVCKVPPGRYVSQGLVRWCPQGFYREQWVDYDSATAVRCLPCNPGITTNGPGAGFAYLCNQVVAGFGISNVYNVTGPQDIPALPQSNVTGLPNATLCDLGFYSSGGRCAQCPSGTVTTSRGAKSVEECVVPPGYYLSAGAMPQCPAGTFREGWLMFTDPRTAACTPCGDGISSEARDLDVNPLAANGSLVPATSSSCFIEAGMGMIAQGKNTFVGRDCPINTYGAAGKIYGWASAPCKPCPRNMITDNATRVNNSDVCINDDGFGYASEGASRCAPGFYALKGSRKPCQQCPTGRTTLNLATAQRLVSDCFVAPGWGIVSSSSGTTSCTDAYNPTVTGLNDTALASFPVLECPVGYYGAGLSAGAKCTACPAGTSTQATGASNATDCNVCLAGYGKAAPTDTTCGLCPYGSWQPGGMLACQQCPNTTFPAPVDGNGTAYISNSTTLFQGSVGSEACVPTASQLSPEAGQAYFSPDSPMQALLQSTTQPNLGACLAACLASSCCLAQYDSSNGTCKAAALTPADGAAAAGGTLLLYKLPSSSIGAASSVRLAQPHHQQQQPGVSAKTLASGFYAMCYLGLATATWQAGAGTNLGPDARTFATGAAVWDVSTTLAKCKARCDQSNVCWGFFWDTANTACLYRGGVDALATRSFFVLPSAVDLATLGWASSPASSTSPCNVAAAPLAPLVSTITTVAGQWRNAWTTTTPSGDGGLATSALLAAPDDAVVDSSTGAMYFTDRTANVIRKVDSVGRITTILGNSTLTFTATTSVSVRYTGDGGPASRATCYQPSGLALYQDGLYFADTGNAAIRRINLTTGIVTTVAGTGGQRNYGGDNGPATQAWLNPSCLAIDARNGDIFIGEDSFPRIRKVTARTGIIVTVAGTGFFGTASTPMGGQATSTAIGQVRGIAVDSQGNVYFPTVTTHAIHKVDTNGVITSLVRMATLGSYTGDGGPAWNATVNAPTDVQFDTGGNLLIMDKGNYVIRRIDFRSGLIKTIAGNGRLNIVQSGDGGPALGGSIGQGASYTRIFQQGTDLWVADGGNNAVRRITNYQLL